MGNTVKDRVSEAIQDSHKSIKKLAEEVGVSRNTIYRWRDKETDKFDDEHQLKKLSNATHVDFEWILKGDSPKSDNTSIQAVERHVAEKGENYKGLDQTLSDVEKKAKNLKQDLEDLLTGIDQLRSRS